MKIKNELFIKEYCNAYAIIGGQGIIHIYDNDKIFIEYTSKRKVGKNYYDVPSIASNEIYGGYVDEEVVYIGFCRGHWGHFMIDSTVRMWALLEEKCRNKKILINIEGMNDFYYKWFEYLGIDKEHIIELKENRQYKKILVPDISYKIGEYISDRFAAVFEYVAQNIHKDLPVYNKIYLSRSHFSQKNKLKQLGEKYIQNIFEKNGYKVLYPEELSFEEQLWYYNHCYSMVTTNGTIAHNVLFMRNNTELIILHRFYEESMHQPNIGMVKNIKVIDIDAFYKNSTHDKTLMILTDDLKGFLKSRNYHYTKDWNRLLKYLLFKVPFLYRIIDQY